MGLSNFKCKIAHIKIYKMKKVILAIAIAFTASIASAQYKVVTVVESILPGGLGRSRMLEATTELDYNAYTTARVDGKDSKQLVCKSCSKSYPIVDGIYDFRG